MFGVTTSDDYRPVAWMGRYPVDVTTILVGLHVACAVLAAILIAFGAGSMLAYLQFDTAAVWSGGQAWRLFTYAFVHAPSALLWFAVELFLRIMAKWIALILAGVYTFQLLAYHAWTDLAVVWTSIGAAFLFIEWRGAGPELAWWNNMKARFGPKPKLHVVQKSVSRRA